MKGITLIQIALLILFSFLGCENTTAPENESVKYPVIFFYAEHSDSYWDRDIKQKVEIENTSGGGVLFADPLPSFEYLKMGDITFTGSDYYSYRPGYLNFIDDNLKEFRITSNFSTLNLEIKTSICKITGTIKLPKTIDALSLSEYNNVALGKSFTISWSGSNADFYSVRYSYNWIDDDDNRQYDGSEEFIKGSSFTIPGSKLIHNGVIHSIGVQPYNGPFPEAGAI